MNFSSVKWKKVCKEINYIVPKTMQWDNIDIAMGIVYLTLFDLIL